MIQCVKMKVTIDVIMLLSAVISNTCRLLVDLEAAADNGETSVLHLRLQYSHQHCQNHHHFQPSLDHQDHYYPAISMHQLSHAVLFVIIISL